MILKTDTDLYFDIRANWLKSRPKPWFKELGSVLSVEFTEFVRNSGGEIKECRTQFDPTLMYGCDTIGIIPGISYIDFADDKHYTMFILKWQ